MNNNNTIYQSKFHVPQALKLIARKNVWLISTQYAYDRSGTWVCDVRNGMAIDYGVSSCMITPCPQRVLWREYHWYQLCSTNTGNMITVRIAMIAYMYIYREWYSLLIVGVTVVVCIGGYAGEPQQCSIIQYEPLYNVVQVDTTSHYSSSNTGSQGRGQCLGLSFLIRILQKKAERQLTSEISMSISISIGIYVNRYISYINSIVYVLYLTFISHWIPQMKGRLSYAIRAIYEMN